MNFFTKKEANVDESWDSWLETKGNLLKFLPLPPSSLLDKHHFGDFVWNYADIYPIEGFSIKSLSNEEAAALLYIIDSYFMDYNFDGCDERLLSELYCDLRTRFGLSLCPDDDFSLPPSILDFYTSFSLSCLG